MLRRKPSVLTFGERMGIKDHKMWEKESEAQGKSGEEGPGGPIENRILIMSNGLKSWGGRPRLRKAIGCSNVYHTNGFQENYSAEGWKYRPGWLESKTGVFCSEEKPREWICDLCFPFPASFPRDNSQSHCCQLYLFTRPVSAPFL